MDVIINKILEIIKQEKKIDLTDVIRKENLREITSISSNKKLAFVDGGNLEILRSPSMSLFFNRIYYNIYFKNKRIKNHFVEFYTLITTVNKDGGIFYRTEYFFIKNRLNLKEYTFDSSDKLLTTGNKRAQISVIGNVIRRFAELTIIREIKDAIVVLDGDLEASYPFEKELLDTNKTVCAVAKTCDLLTERGTSLAAYLSRISENRSWSYVITSMNKEHHKANVYFVKLNPKSKYVFRFEIINKDNVNEILSLLKENSKDPVFLGYPYGLIEADRFARVSNKEKESLQLQLMLKFKENFTKVKPYLNALNAHDILDNIN